VVVFLVCAIICIIVLLVRRKCIGGELGGPNTSRYLSGALLAFLWLVYIIMSILQSSNVGGLGELSLGIDLNAKNPDPQCNK
jgi:type VI protein secretion system component VasK